jgi:putative transposase
MIGVEKQLSVQRQLQLTDLAKSSYYYEPVGASAENLALMQVLDKAYLDTPFYGYRRMTEMAQAQGYAVNEKRVRRLLRLMGIEAIYPKMNLSKRNHAHKIYPYLLRNVPITHINQVWSCDITYIGLATGFMYLVAVVDWHSRYILSWELSNSLDTSFCIRALETAFRKQKPEIFNTDQGVQFTSEVFTSYLSSKDVKISMDGKGRATDNIFIERVWRSLKYEDIYLKSYQTSAELFDGLTKYFYFYNHIRLHQSLGYATPAGIYYKEKQP